MDTSTLLIGGAIAIVLAYIVISAVMGLVVRAVIGIVLAAAIGGGGLSLKNLFGDPTDLSPDQVISDLLRGSGPQGQTVTRPNPFNSAGPRALISEKGIGDMTVNELGGYAAGAAKSLLDSAISTIEDLTKDPEPVAPHPGKGPRQPQAYDRYGNPLPPRDMKGI